MNVADTIIERVCLTTTPNRVKSKSEQGKERLAKARLATDKGGKFYFHPVRNWRLLLQSPVGFY